MPEDEDDLDGCELKFDSVDDKQTEVMLVPKGKERKSWTEVEEQAKEKHRGA